MKRLLKKLWKKEEGFSLIELIVVIAILAIITAIAVPNLVESMNKSKEGVDVTTGRMISDAIMQEIALSDYDQTGVPSDLDFSLKEDGSLNKAADTFEGKIVKKLNNGLPEVKRYSGGHFIASITFSDETVQIVVSVVNGDVATDENTNEVFPDPEGVYAD